MVVAVEDKCFSEDDDESLSDTSSCKDSGSVIPHREAAQRNISIHHHRASPTLSVKLILPVGKPLQAKPVLVKSNFLKTRSRSSKASVPLKSAISKAGLFKRSSSLSQDEKLFVEAAASLVQSAASISNM